MTQDELHPEDFPCIAPRPIAVEDAMDAADAREMMRKVKRGDVELVSGAELAAILDDLCGPDVPPKLRLVPS